MHKNLPTICILISLLASLTTHAVTSLPLEISDAGETSGEGIALRLTGVNSADGALELEPLLTGAFSSTTDFGSFEYDESAVPSVGSYNQTITNNTFDFDFQPYVDEIIGQFDTQGVDPEATSEVVLSNISGPGLEFVDGELMSANFSADVEFRLLALGRQILSDPSRGSVRGYQGTLVVSNGRFVFDVTGIRDVDVTTQFPFLGTVTLFEDNNVRLSLDFEATVPSVFVSEPSALSVYEDAAADAGLIGDDSLPLAIPFADGVENLIKYAFNLDLSGPDSRVMTVDGDAGIPNGFIIEENEQTVWRIQYVERIRSGLIYNLETSTSLEVDSFAVSEGTISIDSIDSDWQRVTVDEAIDTSLNDKLFFRVGVAFPQP